MANQLDSELEKIVDWRVQELFTRLRGKQAFPIGELDRAKEIVRAAVREAADAAQKELRPFAAHLPRCAVMHSQFRQPWRDRDADDALCTCGLAAALRREKTGTPDLSSVLRCPDCEELLSKHGDDGDCPEKGGERG